MVALSVSSIRGVGFDNLKGLLQAIGFHDAINHVFPFCFSSCIQGKKNEFNSVLSYCISWFAHCKFSLFHFMRGHGGGFSSRPYPTFYEMCTSDFLILLILNIPCVCCYIKLVFWISLDEYNNNGYLAGSKLNGLGKIVTEGGSRLSLSLYCRALLSEWQILFCSVGERK